MPYGEPKNIYKAYCRAFLATMEEDTPSLGIATKKKVQDNLRGLFLIIFKISL